MPVSAFAIAQSIRFDIPAQPLPTALKAFADQAKIQLLYRHDAVKGATGNAVVGDFDTRDALQMLLKGTDLEVVYSRDNAATIRPMQTVSNPTAAAPRARGYTRLSQTDVSEGSPLSASEEGSQRSENPQNSESRIALEEIVVTGTNIRGIHPSSSPVEIYTAEDIARTGATTTEQFVQKLPQNLGTRTQYTPNAASANREAVNGVDLRGLGVGTTLTLLNGRRLGLSSNGQTADISMIPLSAIERVEVLTDGASAIYGSDAIGGVVNFVLREDFSGAETRVNYGGVTSGGLRQLNATQAFGLQWESGDALLSYDYFDASPLETSDRSYAIAAGPGYMSPEDRRNSAFMTLSQNFGERLSADADFAFSRRDVNNFVTSLTATAPANYSDARNDGVTEQHFANLSVDYGFGSALNGSLLTTYSNVDVDSQQLITFFNRVPATIQADRFDTDYSALDLTAKLDGTLFKLPSGAVSFSLGGGYLDERYKASRALIGTAASGREIERSTTYAFAELFAPLVADEQNVPLIRRLEISVAARYTAYADTSDPSLGGDFGSSSTPKVGLLWSPIAGLNLRATYGESFRAPSLTQLDPISRFSSIVQGSRIAGVPSTTINLFGSSSELDTETAETYTAGLDFQPARYPGLRLSGTYFSIDYQDRIGQANSLAGRSNPASAPDAVYHPSSASELEEFLRTHPTISNSSGVDLSDLSAAALSLFARPDLWIIDQRFRNLAISKLNGLDLSIAHRLDVGRGALNVGAQATRIFEYEQQDTALSPVLSVVDTVTRPVDLRGRVFLGFSRGGFESTISVNYVDDYMNPIAGAPQSVDSWTTLDCSLIYVFGRNASSKFLSGLTLNLSAQNLFDQDPPYVARNSAVALVNPAGFDPTNANPLGRVITVGASKRW